MLHPQIDDLPHYIEKTCQCVVTRVRVKEILIACCAVYDGILRGVWLGHSPTKSDIKCLFKLGEAIYLLRHKWWMRSEETLGYCAFLGASYESCVDTVSVGYFPDGFGTIQAQASSQKFYITARRAKYAPMRGEFSRVLETASGIAYLDGRKTLQTTLSLTASAIGIGESLKTFAQCANFFTPEMSEKLKLLRDSIGKNDTDTILDLACSIDAHYRVHQTQF